MLHENQIILHIVTHSHTSNIVLPIFHLFVSLSRPLIDTRRHANAHTHTHTYIFLCLNQILSQHLCCFGGISWWDFMKSFRNETFEPHIDTCGEKNNQSTDELYLVILTFHTPQSSRSHSHILYLFSLFSTDKLHNVLRFLSQPSPLCSYIGLPSHLRISNHISPKLHCIFLTAKVLHKSRGRWNLGKATVA